MLQSYIGFRTHAPPNISSYDLCLLFIVHCSFHPPGIPPSLPPLGNLLYFVDENAPIELADTTNQLRRKMLCDFSQICSMCWQKQMGNTFGSFSEKMFPMFFCRSRNYLSIRETFSNVFSHNSAYDQILQVVCREAFLASSYP